MYRHLRVHVNPRCHHDPCTVLAPTTCTPPTRRRASCDDFIPRPTVIVELVVSHNMLLARVLARVYGLLLEASCGRDGRRDTSTHIIKRVLVLSLTVALRRPATVLARGDPAALREEGFDRYGINGDNADNLRKSDLLCNLTLGFSLTVSRMAHIVLLLMPWMSRRDIAQCRLVATIVKTPEQRRIPVTILRPGVIRTVHSNGSGMARMAMSVLVIEHVSIATLSSTKCRTLTSRSLRQ